MRFSIRIIAAAATIIAVSAALITIRTDQQPPTQPHEPPAPVMDDGMLYPVEIPMLPQFPITCVNDGYCDPTTDSICTITYIGLVNGTEPIDLVTALRAMWPDLISADMADCPTFIPLLDLATSS